MDVAIAFTDIRYVEGDALARVLWLQWHADGIIAAFDDGADFPGARRRNFFVPKRGGKLTPGVWERKASGAIKPVLIEVRQPRYRQQYDFFTISANFARRQFPISQRQAMRRALSTAR